MVETKLIAADDRGNDTMQIDRKKKYTLHDLIVEQSQTIAMMDMEEQERTPTDNSMDSSLCDHSSRSSKDQSIENSKIISAMESFEESPNKTHVTREIENFKDYMHISPESTIETRTFDQTYFLGLDNVMNFDDCTEMDSSIHLTSVGGSDSDIQAAINEIRKEASQMDIIMALDQLKTVETDLQVTMRALRERSAEADDLKLQLEEKDEKLASVELERDLYKADASKLKDDLKTCMDRMFDISAVACSSSLPTDFQKGPTKTASEESEEIKSGLSAFPDSTHPSPTQLRSSFSSITADGTNDSQVLLDPPKLTRGPPSRRIASKGGSALKLEGAPNKPVRTADFPLLNSPYSQSIFRQNIKPVSPAKTHSTRTTSTRFAGLDVTTRRRSFSDTILSPPATHSSPVHNAPRICGFFRRRGSKKALERAQEVSNMRDKIEQLRTMMNISLETSGKLRKRLALISRYYDGLMKKMQQQVVEAKTEKAKLKGEMDSKLSIADHEKRVAIIHLERQLQNRDKELLSLKAKVEI